MRCKVQTRFGGFLFRSRLRFFAFSSTTEFLFELWDGHRLAQQVTLKNITTAAKEKLRCASI
jgi:hypothetical protein